MDTQEKISKQLEQISEQLEVLIRLMAIQYEANTPAEGEPPVKIKAGPPKHCPECRAPLVFRSGWHCTFWGCSNYPRCKYSRDA